MPQPPADLPSDSPADARPVVMLQSPREAAAQAIVYRRRRADRPRDRHLRIAGIVGTLLVHLLVLFGAVLGPAYELEEPEFKPQPLQVRLIDKPQPPPPPPVRGTPPRRIGPAHRGNTSQAPTHTTASTNALTPAPLKVQLPQPQPPVITVTAPPATIRIARAAAPTPPLALPHPQPTSDLAPVPLAGTPPQINLPLPPVTRPVPPKYRPEPMRKLQAEGNRPMPTPPSLALPAVPAQAAPPVPTPSIALEQVAPATVQPPSPVTLVRPQAPVAPASPQVEPIPLPAQVAPTINLAPQLTVAAPTVSRESPRVQAPTIQLAEPQLSAVPVSSANAPPQVSAPAIELPKVAAPTAAPALVQPQAAVAPAPAAAPTQASAAAEQASASKATEAGTRQDNTPSSAPEATPNGSDTGTPGAREGVAESENHAGPAGRNAASPGAGAGQGEGKQGKAQPGAAEGAEHGQLGSYVQLKPHGDTQIMDHRVPDIGYRPTRFEGDWTPEGESSIDTALRHAVEKTTIKHTFHLPRGVRVGCKVSPLLPIALFGCGAADPPAKGGTAAQYKRLDLAPVKPLAPAPAASVAPAPAAPIHLDNAAQCAAARVAGGPLPPGCEGAAVAVPMPAAKPASGSSSWVPASDQFH